MTAIVDALPLVCMWQTPSAGDSSFFLTSPKGTLVTIGSKGMSPGASYVFTLVTTSASLTSPSSTATGFASVTLTANQPPRNGFLAVAPGLCGEILATGEGGGV